MKTLGRRAFWIPALIGTLMTAGRADFYFFSHVHSRHSADNPAMRSWKLSVGEIIRAADGWLEQHDSSGLLAIADHNTWAAVNDPEWKPTSRLKLAAACEWGADFHAVLVVASSAAFGGIFDPRGRTPYGLEHAREVFRKTRRAGGLVIAAHPAHDRDPWPLVHDLPIDAVEVFTGPRILWSHAARWLGLKRPHNDRAFGLYEAWRKTRPGLKPAAAPDFHFLLWPFVTRRDIVLPRVRIRTKHPPGLAGLREGEWEPIPYEN